MSVRTSSRRPAARLALVLTLVGTTALLAGCGDGAHLPAGSASSSMYQGTGGTGVGAVDSVLGTDPGPTGATGVTSAIDDPVLAGYDGIDSVGSLNGDDLWGRAASDFNESAGLATTGLDDDPMLDDGFEPVGYGYGAARGGWGDGWGSALGTAGLYGSYGYGGDVGAAALGGYGMGMGMGDAGMYQTGGLIDDPTLGDVGFDDLGGGIDDPSIGIGAADTSLDDGGFDFTGGFSPVMDTGLDSSFDTAGFDPGIVDTGGFDAGFDPGVGAVDVGGFDPGMGAIDTGGFDGGFVDTAPIDVGGADMGGFDAGVGGMDFGGMDAGIGF